METGQSGRERKFRELRVIHGMMALLILLMLGAVGCQEGPPQQDSIEPLEENFESLFDGQTLGSWKVTNFGGEGEVKVDNGQIVLPMGNDLTGITWEGEFPSSNYEVVLDAKRRQGNDFFCGLTFPVDESFCTLIIGGWAGSTVGLSSLDSLDASENETRRLIQFENGRWYRIRLRVASGRIKAWIDEEVVVDVETAGRSLSVRPEMRLSRPFGVASWRTTAALRRIGVKTFDDPQSASNSSP